MPISIDNIFGESTSTGKTTPASSKVSLDNIFASEPVTTPKENTPVTVQSAVESIKAPKVTFFDKVGSFFSPKKGSVLEATILTGPKIEDIDAQEKELTSLKKNLNLYDQKSVDDYNAKVTKLESDITSYNMAVGAKNVLSKDVLQPGTSLNKVTAIPETTTFAPVISEGDTLESIKIKNETLSKSTPNLDFWGKVGGFLKDIAPKPSNVVGFNTGFDLLGAIKKSGILSESPQKTADKEAVTRVLTKNLQDSGQNITLAEVKTNFDQISKQIGLRSQPTNEEFTMAMLMGLGVGELLLSAKLVPALVKTGLGLAGFEALNIADRKLNKLITGTEQTTAQAIGRSLNANEATQAILFIGDMFAKGGLLHFGGKGAIKIGNDFWTEATTKYNLPKSVFLEGSKIKDIFQTGTKISQEEMDLVKSLGLNAEQYKNAIKNGLSIEIPGEYITKIADKPIWSKVKKIIGAEPVDVTKVLSLEGKTKIGPRALLESPTKENIQNIANSIKEGKPIETGPTITPPKNEIASIATEYRQAPAPVEKPELFTAKIPSTSKGEIIAIARHGSTDSNGDKAFRGWDENAKNQLTPKGKEDAKSLGLNIKKNIGTENPKDFVIVSSDLNRAKDSAKIASEISGVPVGKTYPQLRSQDTGDFSGVKESEVKDQVKDINDNRPHEPLPGASETHNDFVARVKEALKPNGIIERQNPGKKIIVVTHHQVEVMSANDFSKTTDAMFEKGIKPGGLRSVKEIKTQTEQVGKATEKVLEGKSEEYYSVATSKKTKENKGNILNKKAIKEYGLTDISTDAGFITPEGTMIDSSGKLQTNEATRPFLNGRNVDHREIAVSALNGDLRPVEALSKFMYDTGNVRISVFQDNINIDIINQPNSKQMELLERISKGKTIYGDISKTNSLLADSGEFKTFSEYKKFVEDYFNKQESFATKFFADDIQIPIERATQIILENIGIAGYSAKDLRILYEDDLINGRFSGVFTVNKILGDSIRLFQKKGKVGMITSTHEAKHFLFSRMSPEMQTESLKLAKEQLGPLYKTKLEIIYPNEGVYAGGKRESALLQEYIVDEWARDDARSQGYEKSIFRKIFDFLDSVFLKIKDTFNKVKGLLKSIPNKEGGFVKIPDIKEEGLIPEMKAKLEKLKREIIDIENSIKTSENISAEAGAKKRSLLEPELILAQKELFLIKEQNNVNALLKSKEGEISLSHPELGKIDLSWGQKDVNGKGGFGLAHILEGEDGVEVANNLASIISKSEVIEKGKTRAFLETPNHRSVIVLDWKGTPKQWILTSYKKSDVRKEGIEPSTSVLSGQHSTTELLADTKSIEQPTIKSQVSKKFPEFDSGNKLEDAKNALKFAEKRMGVSSIVNSLEEKKALIEVAKESLNESPMKELEPYVADPGAYKGELPEVTGNKPEEIKKNPDFKGVKNKKALEFAQKGDVIVEDINQSFGTNLDSEDARLEFEKYQKQKENIKKREKELTQQVIEFGKTDTFELIGKDKTLIGEITATKEIPENIKEIIDQVSKEKKARREEVLNHPARPLMKYVSNGKLPKIGSKTAFGKEGVQILKDLKFNDVQEANKAITDYISKKNEFINPLSRLRLEERNAKFLRDKQQIMAEVEKKIRAEGKNRKAVIEDIRDYFYMTESEVRDIIGAVDYRLLSDKEFDVLAEKIRDESLKIAEHAVAVSEVEWTIAQKELHRVENLQQVMEFPVDLNKMTTEQLNTLNSELQKFEKGDVFLGVREIETLAKNAGLPGVKTQRQILEEVIGKRTNLPIEEIKKIVINSFDEFRGAISLARQNAFYDVLVSDAYQLKIEAGLRYQEIENKTNELVKKARDSRKKTLVQRIAPTDDMVISYLEEGDLETRNLIARDMSKQEIELAHYIQAKYAEMRDFLVSREQLERIRENYYTHRPRGFLEAWLRDGQKKSIKQFVGAFAKAFKETIIDIHKMDEATFKILDEQTETILPLEKFFKYSMRRSGQLIPTKNLAKAFLGYVKTFETKVALDQYIPRMEATARALTPTETTEGGIVKDTSLERFVKKWINTQKGRPVSVGSIHPGDTLDSLLRTGVALTRFLDLALRIPAQIMSLVGEESATFINIGTKKYAIGQYRAKTAQGKAIAEKYESFVGRTFWDKMKDEAIGIESKLGETLFAYYGIAARKANVHHLLGVLTPEEFKTGNISTQRLTEIKMEMNRWRADDILASVMGKTSVGGMFRQHKSWAIPILNQTLSNLQDITKLVKNGEYKTAAKSKEFGELFRATFLTLFLVLTVSKIYEDLKNKGAKRNLAEELQYRAINDAFSFLSALSPTTLFTTPRLMTFITDLSKNVSLVVAGLATGDRTATTGEIPGLTPLVKQFTPKLFSPLLQPSEQDKIMTSITTSTLAAQKKVDAIDSKVSDPAKVAWTEVKKVGVGTEEATAIVNELSDDEYTAYKSVKASDVDYWTKLSEKVTPIVEQAFKLEFGSPEANKLVEGLSDDEYTSYKLVKKNLYGQGEATATPGDWDQQSFIQHISNLAKGWSTDPVTAFDNLIHGDWKITKMRGGQIIVERMPLSTSQEIKTKAAKNNENYRLSHAVPLELGGTNRPGNLQIIETEKDKADVEVENYLAKQLENSNITGREAREMIIRYKAGLGEPLTPELMKEYETKYGSQPLTFDEIKQEVVQ